MNLPLYPNNVDKVSQNMSQNFMGNASQLIVCREDKSNKSFNVRYENVHAVFLQFIPGSQIILSLE